MSVEPIDWAVIQTALVDYVVAGSGLPIGKVIWTSGKPRPSGTYIAMDIPNVDVVGNDWTDSGDNPTPTSGNELIMYARGMRRCTWNLQCFAEPALGVNHARAVLMRLMASLALPSQGARLDAARIGLSDFGSVQTIDSIVNGTIFEPRAVVTGVFHIVSQLSETSTFIETAIITNRTTGLTVTVPPPGRAVVSRTIGSIGIVSTSTVV